MILTRMTQVAETILAQFGGNRALAMIGGKVMYTDTSIVVDFKAHAKNRSTHVEIEYLYGRDLYTVTFWRVQGLDCTRISCYADMYADQLQEIFTRETGLALHL